MESMRGHILKARSRQSRDAGFELASRDAKYWGPPATNVAPHVYAWFLMLDAGCLILYA